MDIQTQICLNPVFIIGSPRSGTSILARSLAHHSQLWASKEPRILADLYGYGRLEEALKAAKWFLEDLNVKRDEFLAYLGLGTNTFFTDSSQGKRWIDHTPDCAFMGDVLVDMFPGASFIHILRDGRRVVNSMVHFFDVPSNRLAAPPWGSHFGKACQTWRDHTEAAMDFCARRPERCLTVVNEELVAAPVEGFRQVLQFLDTPYEEGPANFFRTNRINSSFRVQASGQPDRSEYSEPWEGWSSEQRMIFYWEAGPTMIKYGLATKEEMDSLAGIDTDDVSEEAYKSLRLHVLSIARRLGKGEWGGQRHTNRPRK